VRVAAQRPQAQLAQAPALAGARAADLKAADHAPV